MVAVPSIGRATAVTPRPAAPESDATRRLYDTYGRQILNFCVNQLGNRQEAEDATQTTFLNAFRGLQRGIEPEFESAWLFKIAHNVCLTRQRSSYRRRRVESPGDLDALQDLVPSPQQDTDELIRLNEALHDMPEQQRKALLLREWQGLSYKEIGKEMELSQAAVETLLFRARRSLATGLTEEAPAKGLRKRLRAGGDAGSLVAIVKTLFFSGGVKVVAAVATVAATSAVAATPATRHAIEDAVAPATAHVAPRALASAPAVHAPAANVTQAPAVVGARAADGERSVPAGPSHASAPMRTAHPLAQSRALPHRPSPVDSAPAPPLAAQRTQPVAATPPVATPEPQTTPVAEAPPATAPQAPAPQPPERTPAAASKPEHGDDHPPAAAPSPTGSKHDERKADAKPEPQPTSQSQDRGHGRDGGTPPEQAKNDPAPAPAPAPASAPNPAPVPVSVPLPVTPAPSAVPGKKDRKVPPPAGE